MTTMISGNKTAPKGRSRSFKRSSNSSIAKAEFNEDGDLDWTKAQAGFPPPKRLVSMRLDGDIIDWFKAHGPRYQSRMNAVPRPAALSGIGRV